MGLKGKIQRWWGNGPASATRQSRDCPRFRPLLCKAQKLIPARRVPAARLKDGFADSTDDHSRHARQTRTSVDKPRVQASTAASSNSSCTVKFITEWGLLWGMGEYSSCYKCQKLCENLSLQTVHEYADTAMTSEQATNGCHQVHFSQGSAGWVEGVEGTRESWRS